MFSALLGVLAVARARDLCPIFLHHDTIFFQGDSITDGNRGRSPDPNYVLGHGYRFDIGPKFREENGSISKEVFFNGTHPTPKDYPVWGTALHDGGFLP